MALLGSRPWGTVDWVLDRLPNRSWSLLGCFGPEHRSLAVWNLLQARHATDRSALVAIAPSGFRYHAEYHQAMTSRRADLANAGSPSEGVWDSQIFATSGDLVALADRFMGVCGPDVVLDISTFPKRFFFPFVKTLLRNGAVRTLIATYTLPAQYESSLAEDHLPFASLPLFGPTKHPEPKVDVVVVSAGFMKLGLAELLDPYKQDVSIKTILPFPPGMPAFHRNWEFIREMQQILPDGVESPIRINAFDCADTFAHLQGMTNGGQKYSILAPFGPKPMSLAFCLFAIASGAPVMYTQPSVYNPSYSTGTRFRDNRLESFAYCLRVAGRDLYTL